MITYITATKARAHFFKTLDLAEKRGSRVIITRRGLPSVVIMRQDEYEELKEKIGMKSR